MATSRVKDRPHGGGDDSDDIPPKPEPPPPASGPAIALQVRNDAGANAGCLPADQAETVRRTIEEEFRRQFPDADVRGACVRTHDGVSATTVGIWPQPSIPG